LLVRRNALRRLVVVDYELASDDALLAERIRVALRASGYGPLRHIEVVACSGAVILTGAAPSYHLKQVAQATALAVLGTRTVRNDLAVADPN
jgi:osmotically-inducible protein OsmY